MIIIQRQDLMISWFDDDDDDELSEDTYVMFFESKFISDKIALKFLKHYIKHSNVDSDTEWKLMLMNNHESHIIFEFIAFANENHIRLFSLILHLTHCYVSEWVGSVRFRFGFCRIGFLPGWNRHSADSIRFDFEFFRFRLKRQKLQKLLRLSWRCVTNKYIYMHLLYVACTRWKFFFFAEIIELDRSFSKLFEFCKSDKNWAQLLALKLRKMLKLFATQCFDVLDVLASLQAKKIK
jgi:hypothetical protein